MIYSVPAIEVSRARDRQRDELDEAPPHMETEGAAGPTPTSGRQDGTDRPRDRPPVETMSNNVGAGQIGRQHLEQLAQELAEEVIEDALEHYLRRELQQTAEETVREALAAAGAGEF